jgi:RNA polymerase sigma-70 factor (ECF subfamily)
VAGLNLARGLAARRPRDPEVLGLLALLLLTDARRAARTDGSGALVLLEEQDRTRWDQPMIARGMFHFAQSAAGEDDKKLHDRNIRSEN